MKKNKIQRSATPTVPRMRILQINKEIIRFITNKGFSFL
jgi:hypothetical protein